jgi:hypothetical protein
LGEYRGKRVIGCDEAAEKVLKVGMDGTGWGWVDMAWKISAADGGPGSRRIGKRKGTEVERDDDDYVSCVVDGADQVEWSRDRVWVIFSQWAYDGA